MEIDRYFHVSVPFSALCQRPAARYVEPHIPRRKDINRTIVPLVSIPSNELAAFTVGSINKKRLDNAISLIFMDITFLYTVTAFFSLLIHGILSVKQKSF